MVTSVLVIELEEEVMLTVQGIITDDLTNSWGRKT
jgi:hypothetical protein